LRGLGVNLVILFEKRVRYVKKVKNHCARTNAFKLSSISSLAANTKSFANHTVETKRTKTEMDLAIYAKS